MNSIIQSKKECYFCGSQIGLESHHCLLGKNRNNAEKYGLKVWLCYEHHRSHYGVHGKYGHELQNRLKIIAQKKFEEKYPELSFQLIFKRNYL